MPKLYIISGCNGAGKTTASYTMLPELFGISQFVNSDEFAKGLSPFSPESASVAASRYMLLKIRYLIDRRVDFAIETTLATRSLKKIIRKAQEQGWFVTVIYFWISDPAIAIRRVRARVAAGGHDIPEETVRRRYYTGLRYFFLDYAPIADRWILADNTEFPFRNVATGWRSSMIVQDNLKYEAIKAVALRDEDSGQQMTEHT